jgi:hypothetical protein
MRVCGVNDEVDRIAAAAALDGDGALVILWVIGVCDTGVIG